MKPKTLLSLFASLASTMAWAGGDPPANAIWGEVIVHPLAESTVDVKRLCQRIGATPLEYDPDLDGYLVALPKGMSLADGVSFFERTPGIEFAQPNYIFDYYGHPNDALYPSQWNLAITACPLAWDTSTGDSDTVIAVIDSGVDLTHPDLAGKLLPGWDFGENDPVPMDNQGHGTRCAGIAGAATDNGSGIAGAGFNCMILPVKASNAQAQLTTWAVCRSLWYAAYRRNVKVISMSFGSTTLNPYLQLTVANTSSRALLVAAAGNNGNTTPTYPAALPSVLSVGGSDPNDARHPGSSFGPWVRVAAPGVGILATERGGLYSTVTGTSYAAPLVAGVAGLMFSHLGNTSQMNAAYVKEAIEQTSLPVGPWVAKGRVNARAMLDYVPTGMTKTTFLPHSCQATYGWLVGGGPLEMAASDDLRTRFQAALYSNPIHVLAANATYTVAYPGILREIQIRLEALSTAGYTPFVVRLWSWPDSRWEYVATTILGASDKSCTIRVLNRLTSYVNLQGQVKVGFQGDASGPCEIQVDLLQVSTLSQ
ncbi:MAG TPA: S8 family serine peptidase [Fimbriimonadaceae bacterium]|nr:S8 family serine peptidase [Fimbriimonadaceae bacterium]HRJ97722.1 S8 family serine peptidase [Fimbriimonadaceae bacterium]